MLYDRIENKLIKNVFLSHLVDKEKSTYFSENSFCTV